MVTASGGPLSNAACRRWQAVATYFALLAGATAAVYLPKTDAPKSMEAYNLAIAEMEAGQLDLAERHLKQAEALAPTILSCWRPSVNSIKSRATAAVRRNSIAAR